MRCWKKYSYILILLLGFAGILDSFFLLFISNINVGTIFPGVAGICAVILAVLKLSKYKNESIIKRKLFKRLFVMGTFLFIFSFIGIEAAIILNSQQDENISADYVFILGAGVKGNSVSLTLKERLDKGMEYLQSHPHAKVLVTGGKGFNAEISEAQAMKEYLLNKGLDEERIIMEDKATSTMENFKYSKDVLDKSEGKNIHEITIITSDFHMMRSKMLAARNGFSAYGITCKTPMVVRINSYIREYFAVIKSFFVDIK